MSTAARRSHSAASGPKAEKKPMEPRPSASIILLSPTNQVLLLHRVQTSSAFPSAHVFPGGNLSDFHDGTIPPPGDAKRQEDSIAYRLGAIRETFEESGILLARVGSNEGGLLNLPTADRDEARKSIHGNEISFGKWLESVGGVADTDNLLPFTRWITPLAPPKRFTTQMYIYMLPLSSDKDPVISAAQQEAMIPTPDGGAEITTAHFDEAATWLTRSREGELILYPPQFVLLHLLAPFLTGPPPVEALSSSETMEHYRMQREKLRGFLNATPTSADPRAAKYPTAQIPWGEKVISPVTLGMRQSDQRAILGLDKPGPELRGSARGGDWERVVLVKFGKGVVKDVEVRDRQEVLAEERAAEKAKGASSHL
ncbi:Uu.00g032610.m01.CDS01 [Anthostomella pinea]|uniref:Uu.00g032610.m01.CDS01 n=1 Tax=Anthostomella pinea TaxID=933095 RepID=A0AAI8V3U1_9PEZI|nr:Uu.00g032610.m01.CDS01 [Anthostomella pinea]